MAKKAELPSLEEVECILKQIQDDFLEILGDFKVVTILSANVRQLRISDSKISYLREHNDRIKNMYRNLLKIEEDCVKDEYLSKEVCELDFKILTNMSNLIDKIINKKTISKNDYQQYNSLRNLLSSTGSMFLLCIRLSAVTLRKAKSKDEALNWLEEKIDKSKKDTKSYKKFVKSIKKADSPDFKRDTLDGVKKKRKKLERQMKLYEENFNDKKPLEIVEIDF
ncbi:MAG: hypothetical protein R6U26_04105 [Candidatus Undinarchaeales archaeon]